MSDSIKISSALVSVFNKTGLEPLVKLLNELQVTIYATGGTRDFITGLDIPVVPVEEVTDYPSILGGRVKTLHPKVFGGILGRRDQDDDLMQLDQYRIPRIDLVIVDLYPFTETLVAGGTHEQIIEKIDIGGVSLIRAAAKNYKDVVIVPSMYEYGILENQLRLENGMTRIELRKSLAMKAFAVTSHYDTEIQKWFDNNDATFFKHSLMKSRDLRYGENPHQKGKFFGNLDEMLEQLSGKELSYNNLLDIDAALSLVHDFDMPVTAILKHNNACGISGGIDPLQNWKKALESDPQSAFGGIIVSTSKIDENIANEINKLFYEVLIAPGYTQEALEILKSKKNRIIMNLKGFHLQDQQFRTVLNGVLWQERDQNIEKFEDLRVVTVKKPNESEIADLMFANKIVKHSRSNTIVLVKDHRLIAAGVGQTSRVDALEQAITKANKFGLNLNGAVMASDAFFPFPDCVEIAGKAGIKAVIQPGGSIKDDDSIKYCDENNIAMVTTGIRHFRH